MSETIEAEVTGVRVLGKDFWGKIDAQVDGRRVLILGCTLDVCEHDTIRVVGRWSMHPKYGEQFKAEQIEPVRAKTPEGAIGWLSHRLPGVGRSRAAAMVERFGLPELWTVLADEPERLAEIKGIRPEDCEAIGETYRQVSANRAAIVALRDLGLTEAKATGAFAQWGSDAVDVIRENPYRMIEALHGVGFKLADRVAVGALRLPRHSEARIAAGLTHALGLFADNGGHTYALNGRLVAVTAELLEIDPVRVVPVLRQMKASGQIVGQRKRSQLPALRHAEGKIASRLEQIASRAELDHECNGFGDDFAEVNDFASGLDEGNDF